MARLTAADRRGLSSSTFGLPGSRKYPMPDREHAALAESYATKNRRRGKLSDAEYAQIMAKAKAVLGRVVGAR